MRVVVADDEVLMREGLARVLAAAGFEMVGQAGTAEEAVDLVAQFEPDVLVIDVRMPPTHTDEGLRAAETLARDRPDLGILVLSHYVEVRYALRLFQQRTKGVGYLLKQRVADLDVFTEAVRRVGKGEAAVDREVVRLLLDGRAAAERLASLSVREREVLGLMAEGRSNRGIEKDLYLSDKTVQTHVRNILIKLNLPQVEDDQRRVLAVLTYLRSTDGMHGGR